jgi:hypothetical protein
VKKLAGLIVGAIALLVVSATPARAQMWVSGMFSVQEWNSNWDGSKGFAADFGGVIHKTSKTAGALYADFGYNVFTDEEKDTSIVGGFREFFMVHKYVSPYAHASVGNMHWAQTFPTTDSGNDLILGFGFGAQVNFTKSFGAKVQYDFWRVDTGGDPKWENIKRWTFGGTYMWGGK